MGECKDLKPQRGSEPIVGAKVAKPQEQRTAAKPDHGKPKAKDKSSIICFNCGHAGHFAGKCPEPKRKRVHIRATHSMMGKEDNEEANNER
jgi:hypothetical protein